MSEVDWNREILENLRAYIDARFVEMLLSPHPIMDAMANIPAPPLCVRIERKMAQIRGSLWYEICAIFGRDPDGY